jgi:hypothetical protein
MKRLALLATLLAFDATYMQPEADYLNKNNGQQKITFYFRRRRSCRPSARFRSPKARAISRKPVST